MIAIRSNPPEAQRKSLATKLRVGVPVLIAAGALVACSSSASSGGSSGGKGLTTIAVSYCAPVAGQMVSWVPRDAGIYKKYGLKVNLSLVPLAQQIAQVTAGRVDFAFCDGTAVTAAELGGAKIINLIPQLTVLPAPVYGAPGITSASQVKGKSVGDWGPSPNVVSAVMNFALTKMGLDGKGAVSHRTFTGTSDMMAALLTGQVQAAPVYPPDTLTARKKHLKLLVDVPSYKSPWAGLSVYTRQNEKPANVTAFLKSYLEGIQFIKHNKTNGTAVENSIMKQLKISDRSLAVEAIAYFKKQTVDVPEWSDALMQTALNNLAKVNPKAKGANPSDLYDDAPLQALKKSGFVSTLLASYKTK
jgi:ABC-type nitrate/sulfonate/bicarbonate transport system substrate-binding protein